MTAALVALVEVIILMMWVASFSSVISPLFLYCYNKVSFIILFEIVPAVYFTALYDV